MSTEETIVAKNYAIHDWHVVSNVIVCESQELAEQLTGLNALETEGSPWTDWTYEDGVWVPPQPYPSWIWDGENWNAPVPLPDQDNFYIWDETNQQWILWNPGAE